MLFITYLTIFNCNLWRFRTSIGAHLGSVRSWWDFWKHGDFKTSGEASHHRRFALTGIQSIGKSRTLGQIRTFKKRNPTSCGISQFDIVVSHTGATSQLLTRSIFSRACILSHLFNGVSSLCRWSCHVACHPTFEPYGPLTTCNCKWSYGSIGWTTLPPAGYCSSGKHSKPSLRPSVELQQHVARSSRRRLFLLIVEAFIFFILVISDKSPFYQRHIPILRQRQVGPGELWVISRARRGRLQSGNTTSNDATTTTIVSHRGSSWSLVVGAGRVMHRYQPCFLRLSTWQSPSSTRSQASIQVQTADYQARFPLGSLAPWSQHFTVKTDVHVHVVLLCRGSSRPRRSISGVSRFQLYFQTFQSFVPHSEEGIPGPFGFGPYHGIVPSVRDQKSRTVICRVQEKGLGDSFTCQKLRLNRCWAVQWVEALFSRRSMDLHQEDLISTFCNGPRVLFSSCIWLSVFFIQPRSMSRHFI